MEKTTYQAPEIRNSSDTVIQQGAYGKNTAFCNAQNTGILDYINNNLEALNSVSSGKINKAGDTLTGSLFVKNNDTGYLIMAGGTGTSNGASLQLYGKDNNNGIAYLIGNNGNGQQIISINGNGVTSCPTPATTDNSTKIATTAFVNGGNISASGTNYVRYASGIQICWGNFSASNTETSYTGGFSVNFPVNFNSNPSVSLNIISGNSYRTLVARLNGGSATKMEGILKADVYSYSCSIQYIAIGKWK